MNLIQRIRLTFDEKQLRWTLAIILTIIQFIICNNERIWKRDNTNIFIVVRSFSSSLKLRLLFLMKYAFTKVIHQVKMLSTNTFTRIWCSLNLRILNYPCTPSNSSHKSLMLCPVNESPSTSRTVRKTPKTFGGGMRLFTSLLSLD